MSDLFDILPVSNLNLTDKYNCSGLSYAARNKRKNFCDLLFINNVDVFKCKIDKNGIIRNYQSLMNRYNKALERAEKSLDIAFDRFKVVYDEKNRIERMISDLDEDIKTYNDDCRKFNSSTEYDAYEDERLKREKSRIDADKKSFINQRTDIYARCKVVCFADEYYRSREKNIESATRKDILYRISYIEELAIRDKYSEIF